jgi:hypothetical protein
VDEPAFWTLIDASRAAAPSGGDAIATVLAGRLRELEPAEIVAFGEHWDAARESLFTRPVCDAATLLLGRFGDDSFLDVRAWIVTHGREQFERIVADPDALADLDEDRGNAFAESFGAIVYRAYVAATAAEPPPGPGPRGPYELTGERTDLDNEQLLATRFPRLAAIRAARAPQPAAPEPPPPQPHESFRCPECGAALSQRSFTSVRRGPRRRVATRG